MTRNLAAGAATLLALLLITQATPPPAGAGGRADHVTDLHFDNPAGAAFTHYEMEADIDPATAGLGVVGRLTLTHAEQIPVSRKVSFLLNRDLEIQDLFVTPANVPAGKPVPLILKWEERDDWEPTDFWAYPEYPEIDGLDHVRQIDVWLEERDNLDVWPQSLILELHYSGTVYDSLRAPDENYQRGFETTTGLIDERGAFLSSITMWYPNAFGGPFTFDLGVSCPQDWIAVSQGAMEHVDSGRDLYRWDCPHPMDEIYLIAGPYVLREEDHDGVKIQTFTYGNDDEELCARYLAATGEYLDLYTDLIGRYPFGKFALVENFWQTGYGMPSFTFLGDRVIRLPFIIKTSYGHEILHNWWGNGVFVDYESGNWCEGLTVYGADYLYKEQQSADAARDYRRNQLQEYLNYVRDGRDFPLTDFRSRHDASSAAVGYGKSMMVYHMLRRQLGEKAFWQSLSDFYEEFLFQRANWNDLLVAFADHAPKPMDTGSFYEQWISRTGAPSLTLAKADLVNRKDGQVDLSYQLDQTSPPYALTVPMRATFADREPEDWVVELDGENATGERTLPEAPLTVEVDPEFDLFRRLHRAEVPAAMGQLFGADTVTVVRSTTVGADESAAFSEIATQAEKAKPTTVVTDQDVVLPDLKEGAAWVFGLPSWIDRLESLFPSALQFDEKQVTVNGESFDLATHTIVCAVPNPNAPSEAVGLIAGGDSSEYAAVWRKLPHYGKYSYLVFEGSGNVAKGSWVVEQSPLKVVWAMED